MKLAAGWFCLALTIYLLGNGQVSLWDQDEPRFAAASREMAQGGDWIVPQFNGRDRYDKPILIYWVMSAAMRLLGSSEFSARAGSSLAGAGVVALVFILALRMGCTPGGASVAALVVMLSPLVVLLSKAATADALLLLTIVGAMVVHWEQRRCGFSWGRHVAFWAVVGASVLVKGPPGPAIVGPAVALSCLWGAMRVAPSLRKPPKGVAADAREGAENAPVRSTVAVRNDSAGWIARLVRGTLGLLVLLAVILPWSWAAWERTGGEFFRVGLGFHVLQRALTPLESHGGWVGYYLPVLLLATFPLTAMVLVALPWGVQNHTQPTVRLLACWLVPGVVIFSLARTKLPHYVTPVVPALALLTGLCWTDTETWVAEAGRAPRPRWWPAAGILGSLLAAGFGVALPAMARVGPFPEAQMPLSLTGLVLVGSAFLGGLFWWRQTPRPALITWATGAMVGLGILFAWGVPTLEPLRPSPILARWLRQNAPPGTHLLAGDYHEPSLVYYWGRPIRILAAEDRDLALRLLRDRTVPTALVLTETGWRKWLGPHGRVLPRSVRVRYAKRFYLFQRGRWATLFIVGNW